MARLSFFCTVGPTTSIALSMSHRCWRRRVSRDRSLSARLRHDTFPFERHGRNGQPVGTRFGHHRVDGCAQDRQGASRRLRLGRANCEHRLRALAGAVQGRLRQRLSDRQPGGRQDAVAAEGRTAMVVPVLFRHRARTGRLRTNIGTTFPSSSGSSLRRNGISTMPRSIAAQRPSTIPIMSAS